MGDHHPPEPPSPLNLDSKFQGNVTKVERKPQTCLSAKPIHKRLPTAGETTYELEKGMYGLTLAYKATFDHNMDCVTGCIIRILVRLSLKVITRAVSHP